MIAGNFDWFMELFVPVVELFMELFVPVVIGRSNCFGFGFRQSFENRSDRCLGRPHYKELQ